MSRKVGFDYSSIPAEKARLIQDHTTAIASALRHCSASVLNIGQRLIDVHAIMPRGLFRQWIRAEFEWCHPTACRYMSCAKRFGDFEHAQYLQISAMVLLSQRSTPQAAVDEALAIARSESTVSKTLAEQIIARHALQASGVSASVPNDSAANSEPAAEPQMWLLLQKKRTFVSAISRFSVEVNHVASEMMSDTERKALATELTELAEEIRNASTHADDVEDVSEADAEDAETWLTEAPEAELALV